MPLPTTPPATFSQLAETNETANTLSKRVINRVAAFNKASELALAEATKRFEDLPRQNRKVAVDGEVAARAKKLREVMDEDLAPLMRQLGAAQEILREQKPYFDDPVACLDRETIGSVARARHAATLRHAGAATLEQAAARALRDNDVDLASAVVARLHELPTKNRPFLAHELAKRLQPTHVENMRNALRDSAQAVSTAIISVQAISNPALATRAKIARGVRALRQENSDGAS